MPKGNLEKKPMSKHTILDNAIFFFVFVLGGYAGYYYSELDTEPPQLNKNPQKEIPTLQVDMECDGWEKREAVITAYVPITERHGKFNDGKTSLGDDATVLDGVAVDPEKISYRSKVFIPGVGVREADDTGSAMRNYDGLKIDLRVKDTETALEWGVKKKTVFIKKK
jgi:3D (Asp-Asp-Asp) domain-containing protein